MPSSRPICLAVILATVQIIHPCTSQEIKSICPSIFAVNESLFELGQWGGTLKLHLDEDTMGLFLQIDMDSQINLIINNFGVVTTENNQKYMLEDFHYAPSANITNIDITVKYNGANPTPQIKKIYVNGRQKCPEVPALTDAELENKKLSLAEKKAPTLGSFWSAFKSKLTNATTTPRPPHTTIPFIDIEED